MRLTVRRVVEAVAFYPDRAELKREYPELEDDPQCSPASEGTGRDETGHHCSAAYKKCQRKFQMSGLAQSRNVRLSLRPTLAATEPGGSPTP
jgi:hypothetical protein